jgi:hypothetical protein
VRATPTFLRSRSVRGHAARGHSARGKQAGGGQSGQAGVELVALLPLLLALIAALWQLAMAGHTAWAAASAATAAARAHAIGLDPRAAARAHLPTGLERTLRVTPLDGGAVRVAVRIPKILVSLGDVTATAHFEPQR